MPQHHQNLQPTRGLFDFQVNGFAGIDFQQPDLSAAELLHVADALRRHQTSGIFATLITDSIAALCRKLENIENLRSQETRIADFIKGYHIEGPWLSSAAGYHGAHPAHLCIKPSLADYTRLRDASNGNIRLITLAPEVDGCVELIETAVADGIRVSLGHTNASERTIDDAIKAGATLATHLGNAVPAEIHRHDNVVQRLLSRDELIACLIPDGIHLPPFVLKNFFRAKPNGKVFFTTDCMAAAGSPPGRYRIGPHVVDVGVDGVVRLPGDTRFAGSSLTMDRGLANIVDWLNLDRDTAVEFCSSAPAKHFGIDVPHTISTARDLGHSI